MRKGFHGTSVAGICRKAGVANGSFYQYFRTKHDVFGAIADDARRALLAAIDGADSDEALCMAVFDFFETSGRPFQVFREAEFIEEVGVIQDFYGPIVARLAEKLSVNEAQAWAYLGAQTFVALHFGVWPGRRVQPVVRRAFFETAVHGIAAAESPLWHDVDVPAPPRTDGDGEPGGRAERTRRSLLAAARRLFADKGYGPTKIAEITVAAEVALGTFYVHFPSKRDILRELVDDIRSTFTSGVRAVADLRVSRLEIERRNLLAFLATLASNADTYRIVREAEFAEPAIGRGYYESIASGYTEALQRAMGHDDLRDGDPSVMAWMVMGTAHTAGMRWVLWQGGAPPPAAPLRDTLQWLLNGLEGCRSGRTTPGTRR